MPRTRKTSPDPPPGLPYGEGQTLSNSNDAVGAAISAPPAASPAGPAPVPQANQQVPRGLPDHVREAGVVGPSPGTSLGAPTEFPNEPVTAGIASGRGPGPEALPVRERNAMFEFYSSLADATGDDFYLKLAMKARR